MERLTELMSQLAAEHSRLLQDNKRLLCECDDLRASAEEWQSRACRDCVDAVPCPGAMAKAGESSMVQVDLHADHRGTPECAPFAWKVEACSAKPFQLQPQGDAFTHSYSLSKMPYSTKRQQSVARVSQGIWPGRGTTESAQAPSSDVAPESQVGSSARPLRSASTLPRVTAQQPKLWPFWTGDELEEDDCRLINMLMTTITTMRHSSSAVSTSTMSRGCFESLVMRPNSTAKITWDFVSVVVLGWDILAGPMFVFRNDEEECPAWQQALELGVTLFWTMDIPVSFLSGFYKEGVLELRFPKICRRYVRGWFLLDLPVVLLDWFVAVQQGANLREVVGAGRASKAFRIFRLFRLLRMLKFPEWAENIGECLRSVGLVTAFAIMQSLMIIAVSSHFIACAWYFISGQERPFTWVQVLDDEGRGTAYRYATALHWSVTQFTPASMEVVPRNTVERVFVIVVILLAMVVFSCFVSSITQAMASLQRSHAERDKQQNSMRRYISENRISLDLGQRISRFTRAHGIMEKRRMREEDVHVFKFLPESMRRELHWEVYMPILRRHPLLKRSLSVDDSFTEELCHVAMSERSLGRSEELFHPGEEALHMFLTLSGSWEYRCAGRDQDRPRSPQSGKIRLVREDALDGIDFQGEKCICEVALWLQWELQGYLVANARCECVSLNADTFRTIAGRYTPVFIIFKEYAKIYHRWLQGHDGLPELGFRADTLQDITQEALEAADTFGVTDRNSLSSTVARHNSRSTLGRLRARLSSPESPRRTSRDGGQRLHVSATAGSGSEPIRANKFARRGRARSNSI